MPENIPNLFFKKSMKLSELNAKALTDTSVKLLKSKTKS